jgi:hypothetical protein
MPFAAAAPTFHFALCSRGRGKRGNMGGKTEGCECKLACLRCVRCDVDSCSTKRCKAFVHLNVMWRRQRQSRLYPQRLISTDAGIGG